MTQTDVTGNTSAPVSEDFVDITPPIAPTQTVTPNPDGTLSVTGTGEPGSTITVTFPDGSTGSATVGDDGSYGPIVSAMPQTDGPLATSQTDATGNTSEATNEPYVDITPPIVPTQTATPETDGTVSVTGTGEPGATITVTFPDGTTGEATVDAEGNYGPIASAMPQTTGTVSTSMMDRSGNVSEAAEAPYVDTIAPMIPEMIVDFNRDGTASITGTAEPGSTVTISFPDGSTQSAVADANGNYGPLTSVGRQGPGEFTANTTDLAGNTSETLSVAFSGNLDMDDNAVLLSKSVNQKQVSVGDQLYYTIRAENTIEGPLDIDVMDDLPTGFKLTTTSAKLTRAGADGTFGTNDDVVGIVAITGTDPVRFTSITLAEKEKVQIGYLLKVGATAYQGRATNKAQAFRQGSESDIGSNIATASVQVIADSVLEQSTLIGKVFHDHDGDGYQDSGEEGMPGVRLATVTGLLIETDGYGRYHLPDVDGGRSNQGRNMILKVDSSTLPRGTTFTTENPRVIRIANGALHKVNFGVKLPTAQKNVSSLTARGQENAKLSLDDFFNVDTTSSMNDTNTVEVTLQDDFFVLNSVVIQPQNRAATDEIANAMQQNGGGTVLIQLGQDARSAVLGKARANLIRQQLHQRLGNLMGNVTVVAK